MVVPVPLHPTRRRERGFNQSLILAKELASLRGLAIDDGVLRRDVPTPTQTRLKKRQRRANIAGAFSVGNVEAIRDKRVLLVDDVYTTGSTLNECSKVLVEAGAASVECVAYARAVLE
jgi:ComF family protein